MFIGRVLINNFLNDSFVALRAEIFENLVDNPWSQLALK